MKPKTSPSSQRARVCDQAVQMDYLRQYGDRLDEAERAVKEGVLRVAPSIDPDALIGELRKEICLRLDELLEEARKFEHKFGSGDEVNAIDLVEFTEGEKAAEEIARSKGITDPQVLAEIREFGFHQAALSLELDIEGERDRRALQRREEREARIALSSATAVDDYL